MVEPIPASKGGPQAHRRLLLAPVMLLALTCWTPSGAVEPPRIYAITHATVVPEPGTKLTDGVVILRDGLIEEVGTGLQVPPDAVEIEAKGLWVYPGLLDADSRLGFKDERPVPPAGGPFLRGGGRQAPRTGPVHSLPLIHPEARTEDQLLPFTGDAKRDMERLRNLGFTAVLTSPRSGLLEGDSVAILLAADIPVAGMILRENAAQNASFEHGRFGQGYPTSLMGSVAALRQVFLDTQRFMTWSKRYQADPEGLRRPEMRAAYEALIPVLSRRQVLIFHTDDPRDSLLAGKLADEFNLKILISTRSHEWEISDALAAAGRNLIVSMAFPDKPKVNDDDEALSIDTDTLRRYLEAPAGPARLYKAGVRFAFTLNGLKNSADLPGQMRKIMEAGLPEDVALAAWTTIPAKFLGLDRVVGRLKPGQIANVLVASGPLFAEKTILSQVFVDGVRYDIEKKKKLQGNPDAVVDPTGEWSVTMEIFGRTIQRNWTLSGKKGEYYGTAETQSGTVAFDSVELAGNVLTVRFPSRGGRPGMEVTVIIEGNTFKGTAEMGPRSVEIQGTRRPEGDA